MPSSLTLKCTSGRETFNPLAFLVMEYVNETYDICDTSAIPAGESDTFLELGHCRVLNVVKVGGNIFNH